MSTRKRCDPALALHLAETRILGGNHDITRQHHLDTNRETDSLHGSDDRLATLPFQPKRIHRSGRRRRGLGAWSEELRHVQPGSKIVSFRAKHAHPQVSVIV